MKEWLEKFLAAELRYYDAAEEYNRVTQDIRRAVEYAAANYDNLLSEFYEYLKENNIEPDEDFDYIELVLEDLPEDMIDFVISPSHWIKENL